MKRIRVGGRTYVATPYAARRMRVRGISLEEVAAVLADPLTISPSSHDPHRSVHRRTARGRRLVLVVEGGPGHGIREVVSTWERGQHE